MILAGWLCPHLGAAAALIRAMERLATQCIRAQHCARLPTACQKQAEQGCGGAAQLLYDPQQMLAACRLYLLPLLAGQG